MSRFLLNLSLAVVWCILWGSATAWTFLAGIGVGAVVVSIHGHATNAEPYIRRGIHLLHFIGYFIKILIKANIIVAWEVLTPSMHQTPRIIRYPVKGLTDAQRTTLASAITLTPGSLVVDISPDDEWLYIHCMYAKDRDAAVGEIDELATKLKELVFA